MRVPSIKLVICDVLAAVLFAGVPFASPAHSQTVTALLSFPGQNGTGAGPEAAVTQGRDGELYGTTRNGIDGSIFKVSTSRAFEELYSFGIHDGGCCSVAALTLAGDGYFYGVTQLGGSTGNGSLFKISPSGSYTEIYEFDGKTNGGTPASAPIQASDGNLYGITDNGFGTGSTVYRYTLSGSLSTIYQFSGAYSRDAPLIQASDQFLYGTTAIGGSANCGAVFQMSTAGVLLQSVPFLCNAGGSFPGPLMQASDGNFYGTTTEGGVKNQGTIFKMTPDFQLSILYTFLGQSNGGVDGADPLPGLIQATDGNLYGATTEGGSFGEGTLFRISTDGTYELLYSFGGSTGVFPEGNLMQHTNGMLYGTASKGGAKKLGTVYQVDLGLSPFIALVRYTGRVGQPVQILGQGLTGSTGVAINGIAATSFKVVSDTYMTAVIPSGATTGPVVVTTPNGTLTNNHNLLVVR
jgi:uncharacterized repeat protein (TIGR03803 family)